MLGSNRFDEEDEDKDSFADRSSQRDRENANNPGGNFPLKTK